MRKDMAKVVVERPRRNRNAEVCVKGRKLDFDDMPHHEGMKAGRRRGWNQKELNENLSPLRRYLERQVGRAWNDVYSEICTNINPNSTVQQHVLSHVEDYVEVHTYRDADGQVRSRGRWYFLTEIHGLYVDPDDGILRASAHRARHHYEPFAGSEDYIPFGYERAYQRLNGIWFEVFYTLLPDTIREEYKDADGRTRVAYILPPSGPDVIKGKWNTPDIGPYPRKNRYAHAKRPLTTRELKAAGLVNIFEEPR